MKFLPLAFCLSVLLFSACKKGENDPFLSIKTRDARLSGKWELKDFVYTSEGFEKYGDYKVTYIDSNVLLNGKFYVKQVTMQNIDGNTEVFETNDTVSPYSRIIEIKKDGSFKTSKSEGDKKEEINELWRWANTSKKKTILFLDEDSYQVDRLTNSELVLKMSRVLKGSEAEDSHDFVSSSTLRFEKID